MVANFTNNLNRINLHAQSLLLALTQLLSQAGYVGVHMYWEKLFAFV